MMTFALADTLDRLHFDNRFVRELPADLEADNYRRQVHQACYSWVAPKTVSAPVTVAYSREVAAFLGLGDAACQTEQFRDVFVGNRLLPGMQPYASCYGGHQFGHWAGQLGDGRAINLGEVLTPNGEHWALQLKGAGPTPYSRSADGLAVLRSSVREFLCSEAMHHLGVPSTRALSLILTGESVLRDMFYDGNPQWEPGAVVCRVAPSFIRFGHFELFSARKDYATLKQLLDFTITTEFPALGKPSNDVYDEWFAQVCERTAALLVHWQRVGFVHGVMNTDNLSILGLTIDYGPYGWLENVDANWTPNTTDAQGRRYCFGQQPAMAYWNLVQLANAVYPLINAVEPLQQGLERYSKGFDSAWQAMMAAKLGLSSFNAASDTVLVSDLQRLLQQAETDMTLFYRGLSAFDAGSAVEPFLRFVADSSYKPLSADSQQQAVNWLAAYQARLQDDNGDASARRTLMDATNPLYVLRNYLAQQAIDSAEQHDFSGIEALLEVLRKPYTEQVGAKSFAAKRPDWARQRAGCSMLSCSS